MVPPGLRLDPSPLQSTAPCTSPSAHAPPHPPGATPGQALHAHTCFLKSSTCGPSACGSASFTNQTTSSTVQVDGFLLLGRLASCPSGEGLKAGWVSTEKETIRHPDGGLSASLVPSAPTWPLSPRWRLPCPATTVRGWEWLRLSGAQSTGGHS